MIMDIKDINYNKKVISNLFKNLLNELKESDIVHNTNYHYEILKNFKLFTGIYEKTLEAKKLDDNLKKLIHSNIDKETILKDIDKYELEDIYDHQQYDCEFMEYLVLNNRHKLQGSNILNKMSMNCSLSEYFITELKDELDWHIISSTQLLSEEFIEQHSEYVIWNKLFITHDFSEEFTTKYKDRLFSKDIVNIYNENTKEIILKNNNTKFFKNIYNKKN